MGGSWATRIRVLLGLWAISLGILIFGLIWPTPFMGIVLYEKLGLYMLLLSTCLWLFFMWKEREEFVASLGKGNVVIAFFLCIFLVVLINFAVPEQWRILADETNLLGVSMAIYENNSIFNPMEAMFLHQQKPIFISTLRWDKRPLYYPFWVALLHHLRGYRPDNAFLTNDIFAVFSLLAFFFLLRRFFSNIISLSGVILLAAHPLLVLWVQSGGFEMANVFCFLITLLALFRFLSEPRAERLAFLLFSCCMLGQARYESTGPAVGISFIAIFYLPKKEWERTSFILSLIPAFWLPIFLHRYLHVFYMDVRLSEIPLWEGFSVATPWQNSIQLLKFFLGWQNWYGTLPLVTILAMFGVMFGLRLWWKEKKRPFWFWCGFSLILAYGMIFLVFLFIPGMIGSFRDPVTVRLGIIFLPLITGCAVYALNLLREKAGVAERGLLLLVCAQLFWSWPTAAHNFGVRKIFRFRKCSALRTFFQQHRQTRRFLIVSSMPNDFVPFLHSSISKESAKLLQKQLEKFLRERTLQEILLVQKFDVKSEKALNLETPKRFFRFFPLRDFPLSENEFIRVSVATTTF